MTNKRLTKAEVKELKVLATTLSPRIYENLNRFGVLMNVKTNKKPLGSWKKLTNSDKLSTYPMAIIPNRGLKDTDIHLLVLDIDTKHGAKGLESFYSLNNELLDVFDNLPLQLRHHHKVNIYIYLKRVK